MSVRIGIVFIIKKNPDIFSINIKRTVGVISVGLPFKEGYPRFTTVPFKLFTYQGRQNFPEFFKETLEIVKHFVCYVTCIEFTQCSSIPPLLRLFTQYLRDIYMEISVLNNQSKVQTVLLKLHLQFL